MDTKKADVNDSPTNYLAIYNDSLAMVYPSLAYINSRLISVFTNIGEIKAVENRIPKSELQSIPLSSNVLKSCNQVTVKGTSYEWSLDEDKLKITVYEIASNYWCYCFINGERKHEQQIAFLHELQLLANEHVNFPLSLNVEKYLKAVINNPDSSIEEKIKQKLNTSNI